MENERAAVVVRIEHHWWGGSYAVYESCYKFDEDDRVGMTKMLGEKVAKVILSAWSDRGEETVEEVVLSYFATTQADLRPMLLRLTEAMNENGTID